jgi:hypothetical protein
MNATDDAVETLRCANHPSRETYLRCGKCGNPICTKCTIPTSVGSRCPSCAQIRRLPQYNVGVQLLVPALLAGLAVSAVGWYVLDYVSFLRLFASAFLGMAVGGVMSQVAKKRVNPILIGASVVAVVGGWVVAEAIRFGGDLRAVEAFGTASGLYLSLSLLLACYLAYTRLR